MENLNRVIKNFSAEEKIAWERLFPAISDLDAGNKIKESASIFQEIKQKLVVYDEQHKTDFSKKLSVHIKEIVELIKTRRG